MPPTIPKSSSANINLVSGRELGPELLETWRALQQSNPALLSPYFCPEFTQAVADVREDVEVAVIQDGNQIAAIFPYQRGAQNAGSPVGGGFSDYHGVICAPGFQCDLVELMKACRLVAWDFNHLPTEQAFFAPFQTQQWSSPQMDLSQGYVAYATGRREAGSEQIKKCANLLRRIEREMGPVRFVVHDADAASLEKILALKSQQYLASGKPDLFARPWTRELLKRIHQMQTSNFAGMLSLLYAGDHLVAGHFGMRSRTVWHYWFPAYDNNLAIYSPGLLLLLKMAEYAPGAGLTVIDLGAGLSAYKERLMNESVTLWAGSVELPSWFSFKRRARRKIRSCLAGSSLATPARRLVGWVRNRRKA